MINRSIFKLLLAVVAVMLLLNSMGQVVFTDENEPTPSDAETQDSIDIDHDENEEEEADDDSVRSDDELIEKLLAFQKLLDDAGKNDPDYVDDTRCIDMRRMRHYDVLSGRFVAIEMRYSEEIFLIQFKEDCPGLQQNEKLTFDLRSGPSGRLCVNDHVHPSDGNISAQPSSRGSNCRIPALERITKVQLLQLERGLASDRIE